MNIPVATISWHPCYRIIPSRFPPVNLFEEVADPEDLDAIYAIEALTNDRLRQEVGDLDLVPVDERVSGPGTSPIMAAFTHLNPEGDRFTDGTFGVFYAGDSIDTAVAETRYHRVKFMLATNEPAQEVDMRVYAVDLDGDLHDIRETYDAHKPYYDPENYGESQKLGIELRNAGANGIVYKSVRYQDGECAAIFRPKLLSNSRQERHLCYVWDGSEISDIYEKSEFG
ncbi:RES family NAD+ phosphorylase [Parasphingorhabdus cellanae]|uniref:RES family NAD+ phosphorylase n=1 Tax=Parasphingorhabdus cellanae TaxID=2806553 RepID=A0ABX7T6R6_9SPHN|nr:RES family NAD+ phosphorylase [Parasphingorhabdus cellanae]QTD57294.1 RES family NAD+ phosphorylase [Parasphingorhabdus cellanae]